MSTPNWADLTTIKGSMYLNLKDTDTTRDAALTTLCQMVTDEMISWLDNSDIDPSAPPLSLKRACLEQCCYEWKQRATPGLQSVTMQDGTINKYEIGEWLKGVKEILFRFKSYVLADTNG